MILNVDAEKQLHRKFGLTLLKATVPSTYKKPSIFIAHKMPMYRSVSPFRSSIRLYINVRPNSQVKVLDHKKKYQFSYRAIFLCLIQFCSDVSKRQTLNNRKENGSMISMNKTILGQLFLFFSPILILLYQITACKKRNMRQQ